MENSNTEKRLKMLELLLMEQDKKIKKLMMPIGDYYSVEEYATVIKMVDLTETKIDALTSRAAEISRNNHYSVISDGAGLLFCEKILNNVFSSRYSVAEYAELNDWVSLTEFGISTLEKEALELSEEFEVEFDGEDNIFPEYILEKVFKTAQHP